jgi:hypothetical protein
MPNEFDERRATTRAEKIDNSDLSNRVQQECAPKQGTDKAHSRGETRMDAKSSDAGAYPAEIGAKERELKRVPQQCEHGDRPLSSEKGSGTDKAHQRGERIIKTDTSKSSGDTPKSSCGLPDVIITDDKQQPLDRNARH